MPRDHTAASSVRRVTGRPTAAERGAALSIGLSAVIVAASVHEPRVLTVRGGGDVDEVVQALPSGPLEAEHRTLEIGLRSWVERQTGQHLGYVEQLYTFGDRDRVAGDEALALPALVVAYLALVREAGPAPSEAELRLTPSAQASLAREAGAAAAEWQSW